MDDLVERLLKQSERENGAARYQRDWENDALAREHETLAALLRAAAQRIEELERQIQKERDDFDHGIKPDGTVWRCVKIGEAEYAAPHEVVMDLSALRSHIAALEAELADRSVFTSASMIEQAIKEESAKARSRALEEAAGVARKTVEEARVRLSAPPGYITLDPVATGRREAADEIAAAILALKEQGNG